MRATRDIDVQYHVKMVIPVEMRKLHIVEIPANRTKSRLFFKGLL